MTKSWMIEQALLYQQAVERTIEQQHREECLRRSGVGPFQLKPEIFRRAASTTMATMPTAESVGALFRAAGFEVTR